MLLLRPGSCAAENAKNNKTQKIAKIKRVASAAENNGNNSRSQGTSNLNCAQCKNPIGSSAGSPKFVLIFLFVCARVREKGNKSKVTTSRLPNQPLPFLPPSGNHCQLEPRSLPSSDNNNSNVASVFATCSCSY